ncbi:hypothetical protein J2782_000713 [Brucella pseudogrignonensis]|uniref:TonB C-terminal domain-containing protein n=1 Tax=Brucella pseudogrignonensis TaxID=419475 RepID=A0ABU1M4N4_9HYPH|nr:hypothetical protein [Brucella pseudogrignonensis]
MKNLKRLLVAPFVILPTFAMASDAETVIGLATKCWKIPEDTDYSRASATFEVSYDGEGELTQILTVEFQPVRKAGEIFAVSAQDAIVTCASKTSVRSRTVRVVMRYTEQKSDGPLIMKRPLR